MTDWFTLPLYVKKIQGVSVHYGQGRCWVSWAGGRPWVSSTRQGWAHLLQSLSHLQVIVTVRRVVRLCGRAV